MIKDMESSTQFCELGASSSEKLQKGELMEQELKKEEELLEQAPCCCAL